MSAVSLSLKEKPIDESPKDGSNDEGHDESGATSGGGDPAVLAVGPARRPLTYTRDQLMRLRHSPLVKKGLELPLVGCDALALVLKKRPDSPNEDDRGARGDAPNENHKGVYGRERDRERRSADPRERVRKESEPTGGGIVLSPQRRSFTSGCGAPAAAAPPPHVARTRPESPLPSATTAPPPAPKTDQAGRRIGSGRIMVRDVPSAGWEEPEYRPSEPYRPPQRADRTNGDRFDRRSFTRDSYTSDIKREREDRFNNDKPRDRDDNRRSGGRYSQRRFEKEDEPEWFSGGPTSQLETIELRGFDEPAREKKSSATNNKETEKWNNVGGTRSPGGGGGGVGGAGGAGGGAGGERWRESAAEQTAQPPAAHHDTSNDKDSGVESKGEEAPAGEQPDFNLDEFLKFDSIPDVLTNGGGESEGGSRFSRWFRRESPTSDSRHYERLLNNMVDDLDNSSLDQPGGGGAGGAGGGGGAGGAEAHVFAPISPAAPRAPPSLLDLLRRANANPNPDHRPEMNNVGGKMHSLEELEARLRPAHSAPHAAHAPHAPHAGHPPHAAHSAPHAPHHPEHDLSAFKRLLAQVSGGHAVAAAAEPPRAPPMSLLQMLNKSMEQQKAPPQPQPQPPHIPQELLYKLLQVQQQHQPSEMLPPAPDVDLLQRPEAQAIIHGLKAGEITVQHLMQQLGNPGLQTRHREVLLTILRLHQQRQQQMGGSPLPGAGGAGAAHLAVPPHHQPLRLSPLPHPGVPARIPSPRELAAHTQSIMQGALIKKKLEEQRENYRRRHEQPKQNTPISFTPTSVLRKMTADKESDAPSPKQQWTQPPKMPQGRPIVKGNQSGAAPPMGYAQSPADYQHHYLNQQQQMSGSVRQFLHTQRQVPNSLNNMSNMNNMTHGIAGGTTLHQLLVQSHQRSLNELGGVGGTGGGDNQLARWFSPELLARASAGKLPSVHVPNALSLEDLERHHHSPAPPVRN